jgi:hypothetical protein
MELRSAAGRVHCLRHFRHRPSATLSTVTPQA